MINKVSLSKHKKNSQTPSRLVFPKSPLRYPGGKSRAVYSVLDLIPPRTRVLVSPFLGGGSIEIAAAHLGLRVYGYDVFKPLVDFWTELLHDAERLADEVERFHPMSRDKYYRMLNSPPKSRLESASFFYIVNRCSFSGATFSGGMSKGHPRFTPSSISYLKRFRCPNLYVKQQKFQETLRCHPRALLYLDPPYLIAGKLYGKNGDTHRNFDHLGLSVLLARRKRWILSYNDCPEIRRIYKGYLFLNPQWKYGMPQNKDSSELLILSDDIAQANGLK